MIDVSKVGEKLMFNHCFEKQDRSRLRTLKMFFISINKIFSKSVLKIFDVKKQPVMLVPEECLRVFSATGALIGSEELTRSEVKTY